MHHLPAWLEIAVLVASLAMFVGSLVAVPIALVRAPPDYFTRPHAPRALGVRILRAVLGSALVLLGIAMLVLPGQGTLTILIGIGILDLPWKQRLVRRILRSASVRRAVDRLREKAGKAPLEVPVEAPRVRGA